MQLINESIKLNILSTFILYASLPNFFFDATSDIAASSRVYSNENKIFRNWLGEKSYETVPQHSHRIPNNPILDGYSSSSRGKGK